ncbi:hypothetical protein KY290_011546 [Solanum tuberosum]|uniref:F-box domain-containing protein n=1 Tax=Solanum tuberosum TaxID=4113 RepID=A0ABQ7W0Z0_SOLTU|nr:hypothetical protein KY290_011546 [Solanum tuberosum]
MGVRLEQLPDGVISEIFGKTKCVKSLVRCAKLSTKLEPLALDFRVHTLYLLIIIRQRFEVSVSISVSSVPPSSNSNREMPGHADECVEFRGRGRRWIVNVVRILEKNVELNRVTLIIFKGKDCGLKIR